jgi:hypothetical protein
MERKRLQARESLESAVAEGRRKEEAALDPPAALDCRHWLIAPAGAPPSLMTSNHLAVQLAT